MLIGFNAPTAGPLAAPDNLIRLTTGGEALGFGLALELEDAPLELESQAPRLADRAARGRRQRIGP